MDIPQLFYIIIIDTLVILAVTVLGYILVTGEQSTFNKFLSVFNDVLKFGTVAHGPGNLRFCGIHITQNEDWICSMNADDKLQAL